MPPSASARATSSPHDTQRLRTAKKRMTVCKRCSHLTEQGCYAPAAVFDHGHAGLRIYDGKVELK
jgi:hypothetical protein